MTPLLPYILIWVIMAVILTVKASPMVFWPLIRSWDRGDRVVAILITLVLLIFVFIVFLAWPLKLLHPTDREHLYKYFR